MNPTTGREMSPLNEDFVRRLQSQAKILPRTTMPVDMTQGMDFEFPNISWGEKETVGKSAIQRADREIERWEEVRRAHAEAMPEALPFVDSKLDEAKAARAGLKDCEDNHRVGYVSFFLFWECPLLTLVGIRIQAR